MKTIATGKKLGIKKSKNMKGGGGRARYKIFNKINSEIRTKLGLKISFKN